MKVPKHPSLGLSAKPECGEHNKWKTLPCVPGLTLPFPLWQDKAFQIICFASLVLLIFLSAARIALLTQFSKYFKKLCVLDTM